MLKTFHCQNLTDTWLSLLRFHLTDKNTYNDGFPLYNKTKCLVEVKSISHNLSVRRMKEIIAFLGYIKEMKMALLLSRYFNPYIDKWDSISKNISYKPKARVVLASNDGNPKCIDSFYFTRIKGQKGMEVLVNFRVTELFRRFFFDTLLIEHVLNYVHQRSGLMPLRLILYLPFLYTSSFFLGSADILLKHIFKDKDFRMNPELWFRWKKIEENYEYHLNNKITWIKRAFRNYWFNHRKYRELSV